MSVTGADLARVWAATDMAPSWNEGHPGYLEILEERKRLHLEKSGGYGTQSDPFANFTGVAAATGRPRFYYALERVQEKLIRCFSLYEQGRFDELGEEFTDMSSLLDCAEAMRREDKHREDSRDHRLDRGREGGRGALES